MITQEDFLKNIIAALEKIQIPYMISGSIASSFHGRPRSTNDADIVIAPAAGQIEALVKTLGKNHYVSLSAAMDAIKNNSIFNVIDTENGWKADFIIRKNRTFNSEEFQRRYKTMLYGVNVWIISAEDIILNKLEWAKQSESQRQFQDALGVMLTQWNHLDFEYLSRWSKILDIEDSLEQILMQAKKAADE